MGIQDQDAVQKDKIDKVKKRKRDITTSPPNQGEMKYSTRNTACRRLTEEGTKMDGGPNLQRRVKPRKDARAPAGLQIPHVKVGMRETNPRRRLQLELIVDI